MGQEAKKTRITVDLGDKDYRRLEALERGTEANSKADVVRTALRVHETLFELLEDGGELQYIKDGVITKIKIVF